MPLASIPAVVVAVLIPIGYLVWISKRDFFETRKTQLIRVCFVWGIAAYLLAYVLQSNFIALEVLTRDQVVRFSAPILEEILKGSILVYLIRRSDFTYFVDGAIYGFTTGIGFAIVENFEYVYYNPSDALILAALRALSTNLIHATASGSIGIALGLARFERSTSSRRQWTMLASILGAMALHMTFNNLVNSGAPILLAIAIGCGGGLLVYVTMRRGLKTMKGWVDEELKREASVTSREASVVNQFENVDKILEGFKARFGEPKTLLAKEILLAQAQMGIYRRAAEKHQDETMRRASEEQAASLRASMNENRKKLGTYCMLFLRNIFPEDASPLWDLLQARMAPREERGTGVWHTIHKRAAESAARGETQ